MKVLALGGRAFIAGMKLAGVEGIVVEDKDKALSMIKEFAERKEVGLILLSNRISREIRTQLAEMRKKISVPLLYELPEPGSSFETIEYRALLKQILGVA